MELFKLKKKKKTLLLKPKLCVLPSFSDHYKIIPFQGLHICNKQ